MATEDLQHVFERYDRNKTGAIEIEELRTLLGDMGLLANKTLNEADSFVVQQFAAADADKDSKLEFEEFVAYYGKVTAPKLSDVLTQEIPEKVDQLRQVFHAFASFGSRQAVEDMDGAKFSKLCKDVKLTGKGLSPTDVDLIFVKVRARGERRITFEQFILALEMIGGKKGKDVKEVIDHILSAEGPTVNNVTKADFVKFHDDKEQWTGAQARGGALTVEVPQDAMAALVNRDCGRRSPMPSPAGSTGSRTPGMVTPSGSFVASTRRTRLSTGESGGEVTTEMLRDVFRTFATFGQGCSAASPASSTPPTPKVEMDSARFVKLCRESKLLGGKLTTTAVDLCFTKVKAKGVRKIGFKEFMAAIELLAQEKGVTVEEVKATLASCEGPMLNNVTKADFVKFHDDKEQWTGSQANGGPRNTPDQLTADRLMNRDAGRRLSAGAMSPQP